MKSQYAKQNYYESLEKQSRAESMLSREKGEEEKEKEKETVIGSSKDDMYIEIGLKAYNAILNILDILSGLGSGGWGRQRSAKAVEEGIRATMDATGPEMEHSLEQRLDRIDEKLDTLLAGIKRIDKFTLDAFRNLENLAEERQALKEQVDRLAEALGGGVMLGTGSTSERIPKEETVDRALQAANELAENGERLTLASVARKAGLKYSQVMYAFESKDGFFEQYNQYKQEENRSVS